MVGFYYTKSDFETFIRKRTDNLLNEKPLKQVRAEVKAETTKNKIKNQSINYLQRQKLFHQKLKFMNIIQ